MFLDKINSAHFVYTGLFSSPEAWIHPAICEKTYEIIYVTEGKVYLSEGEKNFELSKGELILLRPGAVHSGSKETKGTAFYWVHFYTDDMHCLSSDSKDASPSYTKVIDSFAVKNFKNPALFKELMHYGSMPGCPPQVTDAVLHHILAEISMCTQQSGASRLASNVYEWTRVNISRSLTVNAIAGHFRYNPEYVSRAIKREYGMTLKNLIDMLLISKAREYLSNSSYSVKEIAGILGFSSSNAFVNFYKYHENISPNRYRNNYSGVHMNKN